MIGVNRALNALEREASRQELGQRRVIEQRDRIALAKTAEQYGHEPAGAARGDAGNIGTIDVPRVKIPPDSQQASHRSTEIRRVGRERRRVDRARGCPADHFERAWRTFGNHRRERSKRPNLISRASAAAREDQADFRLRALVHHRLTPPLPDIGLSAWTPPA